MVEGDALQPIFLSLINYSLDIEIKLEWKNKTKIRQSSIRILKLKYESALIQW